MSRFRLITALLIIGVCSADAQEGTPRWFKGNTHTHSTNSDGDEPPRRVARWYQDHGYNFLVLTDHDMLTEVGSLDTDPRDDFLLIPGEEVSDRAQGKPVHVNALGIAKTVSAQHGADIVTTLQQNTDAIRAAGGIAQINHPSWRWSFGSAEIAAVRGATLLEVVNDTKESNNIRAGGRPGMEDIWDSVLTRGVLIYGVGSDDAHDYTGEFSANRSSPGKSWLMVRAGDLTVGAILASLERGDFYATDGIQLKDLRVTEREYALEIMPKDDEAYTTFFIGAGGKVLKEDYGLTPSYSIRGGEVYVRAKIISTRGEYALLQPRMIALGR